MVQTRKNPPGFAKRLRILMTGWGYSSRDIASKTSVSHMTVENWLSDKHQAGPDQVEEVARLFGWTYGQLYSGEAPAGIMDRVAELDALRQMSIRHSSEFLITAEVPVSFGKMDGELFTPITKRS